MDWSNLYWIIVHWLRIFRTKFMCEAFYFWNSQWALLVSANFLLKSLFSFLLIQYCAKSHFGRWMHFHTPTIWPQNADLLNTINLSFKFKPLRVYFSAVTFISFPMWKIELWTQITKVAKISYEGGHLFCLWIFRAMKNCPENFSFLFLPKKRKTEQEWRPKTTNCSINCDELKQSSANLVISN